MGFRITSASICNVRSSNLLARPSILIERSSIYSIIMVCIILHINMYDRSRLKIFQSYYRNYFQVHDVSL